MDKTTTAITVSSHSARFFSFNGDVLEQRRILLAGESNVVSRGGFDTLSGGVEAVLSDEIYKYQKWKLLNKNQR